MYHLKRKLARDLYIPELQELVDYGDPVEARGKKFIELLDYVSEIEEPWHHCILIPSRRWNPWIALSEAIWILAGRWDTKSLLPYNSHITDYSDDGESMWGAYGARIFYQIDDLIERLKKDPNDRRAVLSIWLMGDLTQDTKDPPCNNLVYFKLRRGRLHMTVICRSNDIHWGLFAVNIPTFGILQEYIAARLGVNIGHQTHLSNSLHVYTDNKQATDITDRMLYREPEDMPRYPEHRSLFGDLSKFEHHEGFANMCSAALEDVPIGSGAEEVVPFLCYAREFLRAYRNREWPIENDYWGTQYPDWALAGKLFTERVWKHD